MCNVHVHVLIVVDDISYVQLYLRYHPQKWMGLKRSGSKMTRNKMRLGATAFLSPEDEFWPNEEENFQLLANTLLKSEIERRRERDGKKASKLSQSVEVSIFLPQQLMSMSYRSS